MKKLCMILTILYCLSLCGCGKPADSQGTTGTGSTTETTGVADAMDTTGSADSEETTGSTDTAETTSATKPTGSSGSSGNSGGSSGSTGSSGSAGSGQTPKPTVHTCAFGNWVVKTKATCSAEGKEERSCTGCSKKESRAIAKTAHDLGDYNVCKTCSFVDFDPNAAFVELGIPTLKYYSAGSVANYVWDVKIWNGRVFRGAGDYDKNSGTVRIFAYDIASQTWKNTGGVSDQAIHRFVEIDGKLMSPGIDPTGSWDSGNYYILNDSGKSWTMKQNLPNAVHNFDMIEFDGKIFAGLGTENPDNTVAMSEDGGETFKFVPLYKDGQLFDTSDFQEWTRTYEFTVYNNELYAMVAFRMGPGTAFYIFRYEDGKMVYMESALDLASGSGSNRNYWNGEFEFGGACYLTSYYLYAITDFSNRETHQKIEMPNKERVADAMLRDGVIYVLCFKQDSATKEYNTVIYKTTTGKAGSFEEVTSFTYPTYPCSFDTDGTYFYIGTAAAVNDTAKNGMILRVKPAA